MNQQENQQESQQEVDFGDFEVSSRANYRKMPVEKVKTEKPLPEYNVKFNFEKRTITLDTRIAEQINLAENSLAHAPSKKTGQVAIIVVPGKNGLFGKGTGKGDKGRVFKNRKLAEDLVDLNLTSGKYKMDYLGVGPAVIRGKKVDGCIWYTLSMIGDPQIIDLTEEEEEEEVSEPDPSSLGEKLY